MSLDTLFTIYLVAALIGLSMSLFSFLFGGFEDVDTEVHLDTDHLDVGHGGITISTILTLRNFMAFLVGFGAAGMIALNAGYSAAMSIVLGFLGGVFIAFLGFLFFRLVAAQQGNSATNLGTLVGKTASVVTGIPADGLGEVRLTNEYGALTTMTARTDSGTAIQEGKTVSVKAVVGDIVVVAPAAN